MCHTLEGNTKRSTPREDVGLMRLSVRLCGKRSVEKQRVDQHLHGFLRFRTVTPDTGSPQVVCPTVFVTNTFLPPPHGGKSSPLTNNPLIPLFGDTFQNSENKFYLCASISNTMSPSTLPTTHKSIDSFLSTRELNTGTFNKLKVLKKKFLQRCTPLDQEFVNHHEIVNDLDFSIENAVHPSFQCHTVFSYGSNASKKLAQSMCTSDVSSKPLLDAYMKVGMQYLGATAVCGKVERMQKQVTMQISFLNYPMQRSCISELWLPLAHAWLSLDTDSSRSLPISPVSSTSEYGALRQSLNKIHERMDGKNTEEVANIFSGMLQFFNASSKDDKTALLTERKVRIESGSDLDSLIHRMQIHLFSSALRKIALAAPVVLLSLLSSQQTEEIYFLPHRSLKYNPLPLNKLDKISEQLYMMRYLVDFCIHEHLAEYMRNQHTSQTKASRLTVSLGKVINEHIQYLFAKKQEMLKVDCHSAFLFDRKFSLSFCSWKDWMFNCIDLYSNQAQSVNPSSHFSLIQNSSVFQTAEKIYIVRDMDFEQFCFHGLYTIYPYSSTKEPEYPCVKVKKPQCFYYHTIETELFRCIHDSLWEKTPLNHDLRERPLTRLEEIEVFEKFSTAQSERRLQDEELTLEDVSGCSEAELSGKKDIVSEPQIGTPSDGSQSSSKKNARESTHRDTVVPQKKMSSQQPSLSPQQSSHQSAPSQNASFVPPPPSSQLGNNQSSAQPIVFNVTINNYSNSNNNVVNGAFVSPANSQDATSKNGTAQFGKSSAPTADDIDTSTMDLPVKPSGKADFETRFQNLLGHDYQTTLRGISRAKPLPDIPSVEYPLSTASMNLSLNPKLKWDEVVQLIEDLLEFCNDPETIDASGLKPLLNHVSNELALWRCRRDTPNRIELANLIELAFDLEVACGVDLREEFQEIFGFSFENQERRLLRTARLMQCWPEWSIPFSVELPFCVQHQFMKVVESYLLNRDNFTVESASQFEFLSMTCDALAVFGSKYIAPCDGNQYSQHFRQSMDMTTVLQRCVYVAVTYMCAHMHKCTCEVSLLSFILLPVHISILKMAISEQTLPEDSQRLFCSFFTMLFYSNFYQQFSLPSEVIMSFESLPIFSQSLCNAIVLGRLNGKEGIRRSHRIPGNPDDATIGFLEATLHHRTLNIGSREVLWREVCESSEEGINSAQLVDYLRVEGGLMTEMQNMLSM
mmetsp:Transcript_2119/g.7676  ORF Transcript_2119/g.7676 Transcript_2119/m.7676 type:complete len:1197 (-) Transcript_2119:209-3799(-)